LFFLVRCSQRKVGGVDPQIERRERSFPLDSLSPLPGPSASTFPFLRREARKLSRLSSKTIRYWFPFPRAMKHLFLASPPVLTFSPPPPPSLVLMLRPERGAFCRIQTPPSPSHELEPFFLSCPPTPFPSTLPLEG